MAEANLLIKGMAESGVAALRQLITGLTEVRTEAARTGALTSTEMRKIGLAAEQSGRAILLSARQQVQAEVQRREALQATHASYVRLARDAVRGSEEQQAANRLATKSAEQLGLAYRAAGRQALAMGRDTAEASRFGRGFLGRTTGVGGRAFAFGSSAFLAGALGGVGMKAVMDEARNAIQVENQLRFTMDATAKATGRSDLAWSNNREQIVAWAKEAMKATSFQDERMLTSFQTFVRITKDVAQAQKEASLAADLARNRHVSLEQATSALVRVQIGNVAALRRIGIPVQQVTTNMDALKNAHIRVTDANRAMVTQLQHEAAARDKQATRLQTMQMLYKNYTGAAQAYSNSSASATERLSVSLKEAEEVIGKALMPEVARIASEFANWITKMRDSGQLQKDAKGFAHDFGEALKGLAAAARTAKSVIETLDGITGSFKNTLELLIGLKVAKWALTSAAGLLRANTELAGAGGRVGLLANLKTLAGFAGLVVTVMVVEKILSGGTLAGAPIGPGPATTWQTKQTIAGTGIKGPISLGTPKPGDTFEDEVRSMGGRKVKLTYKADGLWHVDRGQDPKLVAAYLRQAAKDAGQPAPTRMPTGYGAAGGIGAAGPAPTGGRPEDRPGARGPGGTGAAAGVVGLAMTAARSPGASATGFHLPGERTPYDCSAFVQAVFRNAGIPMSGSTTYTQYAGGRNVQKNDIQAGDLVFFNYPGERSPGHVGIAVGGGYMVHDHGAHGGVSYQPIDWGAYVGARCYIASHNHVGARRGAAPPGATTPPPVPGGSFDQQLAAAAALGTKPTTQHGRLTAAAALTARAAVGEMITAAQRQAREKGFTLDPTAQDAIKHLEALRDHLRKGITSEDAARTRASIKHWGTVLRDELAKQARAAAEAAADAKKLLERNIRDVTTGVFRQFDQQTADFTKAYQRDTQRQLQDMQQAFQLQMRGFDRATQRALQGMVVAETPEEAALRQFQESRQAQADAATLAAAYASGDPQQIRQAELDRQEKALQKAADQSRKAQDAATQSAQDAYQQQRDDQRQALQEQENDREQAFQDQRDAELQNWKDRRDDQRVHLQDDLDDWNTWITDKKKTWADFLSWLSARGFVVPSDWFTKIDDDKLQQNIFGISQSDRDKLAARMALVRGGPAGLAGGGIVTKPTLAMLGEDPRKPREAVFNLDDERSIRILREALGGGGGNVILANPIILGRNREAARELARYAKPELARQIGYNAP